MDFEQIYKAYFTDVYLYIKGISKSEEIAEEITSETFFRAMKSINSFRGDCDVRVWLCQIAKNCYFTFLKKNSRFADCNDVSQTNFSDGNISLEDCLIDKNSALTIHMLLHTLDEPYKEVFSLRVFGELSFKAIGQIFNKSENWACVTYHRSRQKLIKKMEENNYEK